MLERDYPDFSKAAIFQNGSALSNWIVFHNRFTKDNITVLLSHREFEIALLVMRGAPRTNRGPASYFNRTFEQHRQRYLENCPYPGGTN